MKPCSSGAARPALRCTPLQAAGQKLSRTPRPAAPSPAPRPPCSRFLQGPGTDPEHVRKLREGVQNGTGVTVRLLNCEWRSARRLPALGAGPKAQLGRCRRRAWAHSAAPGGPRPAVLQTARMAPPFGTC